MAGSMGSDAIDLIPTSCSSLWQSIVSDPIDSLLFEALAADVPPG